MSTDQHTVSRPFAAEILNVSLRTLDRYAKKDTISSVRRGRQLYFSEEELLNFKAQLLAEQQLEQVKAKRELREEIRPRSSHREFHDIHEAQVMEQDGDGDDAEFAGIRNSLLKRDPEVAIYKGLYEKGEGELKEARQKLEMANYQVGKLEAQVKSMVPLIAFKKQKQELLQLSEENRLKQDDIAQLEKQVRMEQFVKKLYAVFLFVMMGLLPLLMILRLFA
ncbi:MAG: helix-turn-helix domain-containing protein [bacterium]|nr:helix-turn-helix domain-containing protein [bacterium]